MLGPEVTHRGLSNVPWKTSLVGTDEVREQPVDSQPEEAATPPPPVEIRIASVASPIIPQQQGYTPLPPPPKSMTARDGSIITIEYSSAALLQRALRGFQDRPLLASSQQLQGSDHGTDPLVGMTGNVGGGGERSCNWRK